MVKKIPDTNNLVGGKTPGQIAYNYLITEDICPQCRARWTDPNSTHCANCDARITTYVAKRLRMKRKRDMKRPSMADVVISRNHVTNKFQIAIYSDVGTLIAVHNLDNVAIRDARHGKAVQKVYRKAA
jgi:hypothetical protein